MSSLTATPMFKHRSSDRKAVPCVVSQLRIIPVTAHVEISCITSGNTTLEAAQYSHDETHVRWCNYKEWPLTDLLLLPHQICWVYWEGLSSIRMSEESIIRIPPYHYIHVLDQNSNISRVETGPKTYIRQDNERVLFHPVRMVMVPPRHYCVIQNPVVRDQGRNVQFDDIGQAKLRHGDQEIRLAQDPFPLYPGEELQQGITPLTVVLANTALHLKALLDFEDDNEKFVAGDEWLFEGPGTYIPRKEVEVLQTIQATVIRHNQAIRLRARKECQDREDHARVT
ncbi:hypothetical protein GDO81_022084, partial [Engystomops pustulosus]